MKIASVRRAIICLLGSILLLIPVVTDAQIPQAVSYQGYLTDATTGDPVDTGVGTIDLEFSLYDVASGGSALWTETQQVVVKEGVYSVTFSGLGGLDFDSRYYLQVAIDENHNSTIESGEILSPRQPFSSVPYALNADRIDGQHAADLGDITAVNPGTGLTGGGTSGDLTLSANTTYLQRRVTGSCAGQVIVGVNASGTVTCEPDDGITTETDPTVNGLARTALACTSGQFPKWNGSAWACTTESDPQVGANTTNYVPKWSGSALVKGSIYDNGNIGIGTPTPNEQLEITENLRLPATTATTGIIKQGADTLIHTYGTDNFFAGINGGNLSMTGNSNNGIGKGALYSNTTGNDNIAIGNGALYLNTTGSFNVAIGLIALRFNTSGYANTAVGVKALYGNSTGAYNTANGYDALHSNSSGSDNTAIGSYALWYNDTANKNTAVGRSALFSQSYDNSGTPWDSNNTAVGYEALYSNQPTSNSNGVYNTAVGSLALRENTTGLANTAIGMQALGNNTTGKWNTANGAFALVANSTGNYNTASGYLALLNNTTGNLNAANGAYALNDNTTGSQNAANGADALGSNITGSLNSANGFAALYWNTTGGDNAASGAYALYKNVDGHSNTASGSGSLYTNVSGWKNTAIGWQSLYSNTGNNNTAVGWQALYGNTTGYYNTAIGFSAGVTSGNLTNTTAIGYNASVDASNKIVIGNDVVASIGGYAPWSNYSDRRVKKDIEGIEYGIDLIKSLKPVQYKMKNGNGNTDFGFVAQDIETVLGKSFNVLDIGGGQERMLSLRYTQFIAPMVKAMQEQQEMIEQQQQTIDALKELVCVSNADADVCR